MNRNYPTPRNNRDLEQWAASRETSEEVAKAIEAIAGANRAMQAIWEAPTPAEVDNIEMCLNEWARLGDIEPGAYHWGEETITASAE